MSREPLPHPAPHPHKDAEPGLAGNPAAGNPDGVRSEDIPAAPGNPDDPEPLVPDDY